MLPIAHPLEAIKNLEYALNKLDYSIGCLCRNDPETWVQIHQNIENFKALPFGDKMERIGELGIDFIVFPALINKTLALAGSALQDVKVVQAFDRIFELVADLASKVPAVLGQEEMVGGLIQDFSKIASELEKAPSVVATTPEGITVAVQGAEEGMGAEGAVAKGTAILEETENAAKAGTGAKVGQEIEQAAAKVKPTTRKDGLPLDERLRTHEQRVAVEAKQAIGKQITQTGEEFENSLQRKFGGTGRFTAKTPKTSREFDGAFGDVWYEAKYGTERNYWKNFGPSSESFKKFTSDMGRGLAVSTYYGKKLELFTNSPIPEFMKAWLNKHGIKFTELLD